MAKQYYLPTSEDGRRTLVHTLDDNLAGAYATKYNIPAGDLTDLHNFRLWNDWCADALEYTRQRAQGYTQFRDALAYGANHAAGNLTPPVAFSLPPFPAAGTPPVTIVPVAEGFKLIASIVNRIKNNTKYEVADGEALGIEGAQQSAPDPATTKPVIKAIIVSGGKVQIQWKKLTFTGVRLEVDRGTGQWVFLDIDTKPHYDDPAAPAPGTTALWKYRAIYLQGDQVFGQWSDVASIAVHG